MYYTIIFIISWVLQIINNLKENRSCNIAVHCEKCECPIQLILVGNKFDGIHVGKVSHLKIQSGINQKLNGWFLRK